MEGTEDCEACWICLEGVEGADAPPGPLHANRLIKPCRCPRVVHSVCLAKWQLSQSGRSEEKFCRFCKERLPNWQANLALPGMGAVEPVMSVHFNGQTHMVKVKPGEEGRVAFIQDVRRLLRLRDNQEFSITFECKVPGHGMFLDLKGLSSYDAAVFCAAMTAVERQRLAAQKAQQRAGIFGLRGGGGSALSSCASAPAAPGLATGVAAAAASASRASNSSSNSSSNDNSHGRGTSGSGGGGQTSSSSAGSYMLTHIPGSVRHPQTGAASSAADDAESDTSDTPASSQTRPRAASLDDVGPPSAGAGGGGGGAVAAARRWGVGDDGSSAASRRATGESANAGQPLLPSSPSAPLSVRMGGLTAWPSRLLHGLVLAAANGGGGVGATQPPAAMGVVGTAEPAGARSISASGPPLNPGAGPRFPRIPAAGVGARPGLGNSSSAYDSACEVEPSEAAAGDAAAVGESAPAAGAVAAATGSGGPDGRNKWCVRHLRNGHVALSGGSSGGGGLSAPAEPPSRRGDCSNATWLSRLLLCASFRGSLEAGR